MDYIYYRYVGVMRDFNGNLFPVEWAACDPDADDFPFVTPFRSGIWADSRPFDLGDIGEIPQRFYPGSRAVVPKRVCLSCFVGDISWWESGWPLGTPAVVLAADGWPLPCQSGEIFQNCSCAALAVDYFPLAVEALAACSCSAAEVEYQTHVTHAVSACSCSAINASYGDHVHYGVNVCSCSSPDVEYTEAVAYAVSACSCSTETLTYLPGITSAVSACSCSDLTFTYEEIVPLYTFGCNTIAATGTTQGTAALVGDDNVTVTTADASNTGIILPDGCYRIFVKNPNANPRAIQVYPPSGQQFRSNATNASQNVNAGESYFFIRVAGETRWEFVQFS